MLKIKTVLLLAFLLMLTSCANTKYSASKLPKGVKLNKSISLPLNTKVSYYIPEVSLKSRFYSAGFGAWIDPGFALSSGVKDVFNVYFSDVAPFTAHSESEFSLLFDIKPKWEVKHGKVVMTMKYKVFYDSELPIKSGSKTFKTSIGNLADGTSLYNAAMRSTQLVLVEVINSLASKNEKYAASRKMKEVDLLSLADMEKPVSSGTGFYINETGQVLTAAHVLSSCLVTKVHSGDKEYQAKLDAKSILLDLAVVNTGSNAENYLPLRNDTELFLGEPVTNVGYPLQGLLAASPNLTRGNISSKKALKGSVGLFQFSAPIQPGSSGGPVVSDGGELLGVTVSTLNSAALIKSGALPQNVNFALDAKYAAMFLQKHEIPFHSVDANLEGNIRVSNNAALSSVVQLACYQ